MPRITKEQAAAILGKTTRAVERYAADPDNKLSIVYEKGRTRDVPTYDEGEIRALAERLRHPSTPAQAVITTQSDNTARDVAIRPQQALQAAFTPQDIAPLGERLINALEGLQRPPAVAIADALMLTLAEAAALTRLSRVHLRQAIEEGKLKARIIGKGWKIKRADLDSYVEKL